MTDFILGDSKITADGDFSHEIKKPLLLRRKAMKNLDCVLKSRGITLLTKVCIVKAMLFPLVMYGGESWMIKKVARQIIDAFDLCVGEESSPGKLLNNMASVYLHELQNHCGW